VKAWRAPAPWHSKMTISFRADCFENDPPPQREEGPGVVGGCPAAPQPPLTPPYQGREPFSWFQGARQPTGMSDCFETRCHSERSEESRPGLLEAVCPTQSKIPRFARNDISCFLGARKQTGMSDSHV